MRKSHIGPVIVGACLVPLAAWGDWAGEDERARKDREHRRKIDAVTESAGSRHGGLTGLDHLQIGLLHEFDGYYADAIASYEEAERLGLAPLPGLKGDCRRALAGDTSAVDARRETTPGRGTRITESLLRSFPEG